MQMVKDQMDIKYLKDKDEITVGTHKGIVYHTPGHTPGSLCYHFGHFLFSGDTLLCEKVGETSYPESEYVDSIDVHSSLELMKKSIRESLFPLSKETLVLPGHGPFTSIGTENLFNPIVGSKSKPYCLCYKHIKTTLLPSHHSSTTCRKQLTTNLRSDLMVKVFLQHWFQQFFLLPCQFSFISLCERQQ